MWRVVVILAFVTCSHAADTYKILAVPLPAVQKESRIIGGNPTIIQKYPFAVQVLKGRFLTCGGSLLTRWHVLTAAHCFVRNNSITPAINTAVRVGTTFYNLGGSVHAASEIFVHENYSTWNSNNDIAVILLKSRVTLSEHVSLALIPKNDHVVPDNDTVIAIGWGTTVPGEKKPPVVLHEVEIRKVGLSECSARYGSPRPSVTQRSKITTNMICAGLLDIGGKDACKGDSGGPLIHKGVVVGVTSFGTGCARPKYPGVYTRVANYLSWITTVTQHINVERVPSAGIAASVTPLLLLLSSPCSYLLI